jgi:hypothetical protein
MLLKHTQYKELDRKREANTAPFCSLLRLLILLSLLPTLQDQSESEAREIVIHSVHRYFFFEMAQFVLMLAFLLQQTTKFFHQRLLWLLLLDCQLCGVVHPGVRGQPVAVRGSVSPVGLQIEF